MSCWREWAKISKPHWGSVTHTLAGAGRRIRRDLLLLLDWHHPMPTADWWPANHTDPPKLLGVKDTDSKGSRPTLYGFNVRSFSEKPHAVTASAYSEASRPHKRYQVHLNAHHIPHTLLLPLPQTTGQASPFTHRLAVLPKAKFKIHHLH